MEGPARGQDNPDCRLGDEFGALLRRAPSATGSALTSFARPIGLAKWHAATSPRRLQGSPWWSVAASSLTSRERHTVSSPVTLEGPLRLARTPCKTPSIGADDGSVRTKAVWEFPAGFRLAKRAKRTNCVDILVQEVIILHGSGGIAGTNSVECRG